MEKITGIYKISNYKSKNFYIGQAKDFVKRVTVHKCHLRHNKHRNGHLQNAWNKYGEDSFKFEIILKCKENELQFYEQQQFDIWWHTGRLYNVVNKSEKIGTTTKAVKCYDKDGSIVKYFKSINDAADFYKISPTSISQVLNGRTSMCKGYYWGYANSKPLMRKKQTALGEKSYVCCYNKDGELLNKFKTVIDASRFYNIHNGTIYNVCEGRTLTAGGYYWAYEGESPLIRKVKTKKSIRCYDDDRKMIKEFDSIVEASIFYNISISVLRAACNGKYRKIKNMFWSFANRELIIKDEFKHPWSKKVFQYDLENNLINNFNSIGEAARFIGCHFENMRKACMDGNKIIKDFKWRYI